MSVRAWVDSTADLGDPLPWQSHLYHGPTVEAVLEVIAAKQINNLVLGTVARTGMAGLLIGNTAESILDEVTSSVLSLKPQGFDAPTVAPPLASIALGRAPAEP